MQQQFFEGELTVDVTDELSLKNQKSELEALLSKSIEEIGSEQIPLIYGIYKGSILRKQLFALLAFKHFQPLLGNMDMNVLHIENSYELWPTLLATRWAEKWSAKALPVCGDRSQIFAWMCLPSMPSPSLKYMRELNAPSDHKLYLASPSDQFEAQLDLLSPKYIKLLSKLIPEYVMGDSEEKLKNSFKSKLTELNELF
jgi:hypothetical protein